MEQTSVRSFSYSGCEITPRAARGSPRQGFHTIRYDLPPPALAGWFGSNCAAAGLERGRIHRAHHIGRAVDATRVRVIEPRVDEFHGEAQTLEYGWVWASKMSTVFSGMRILIHLSEAGSFTAIELRILICDTSTPPSGCRSGTACRPAR